MEVLGLLAMAADPSTWRSSHVTPPTACTPGKCPGKALVIQDSRAAASERMRPIARRVSATSASITKRSRSSRGYESEPQISTTPFSNGLIREATPRMSGSTSATGRSRPRAAGKAARTACCISGHPRTAEARWSASEALMARKLLTMLKSKSKPELGEAQCKSRDAANVSQSA
eukprot:scaffold71237_cov30-Tisochrysis_lutea.AAC.5